MTIEETNEYFINLMNDFIQERILNYDEYTYTDEEHKEERESELINESDDDRIDRLREEFFNICPEFGSLHTDVSEGCELLTLSTRNSMIFKLITI